MKRLLVVSMTAGLCACPGWDAEVAARCVDAGFRHGVCASSAVGGGGGAGGGGGGAVGGGGGDGGALLGVDDAGLPIVAPGFVVGMDGGAYSVASLPTLAQSSSFLTAHDSNFVRVPRALGQAPGDKAIVLEARDEGFSVYREGNSAQSGSSPNVWCASAVNPLTNAIGTLHLSVGGVGGVGGVGVVVDDFTGPSPTVTDWSFEACVPTLAQYVRADGGLAFVGMAGGPTEIIFERTNCPASVGCERNGFLVDAGDSVVHEAAVDLDQRMWVSATVGPTVAALIFRRDASGPLGPLPFSRPATARVHVAAGGASAGASMGSTAHFAWLNGRQLVLGAALDSTVGTTSIVHELWWGFGDAVTLVDLVDNGTSAVAIVRYPDGAVVALHHAHAAGQDTLHKLGTPANFVPTVAHLRQRLRVAGYCAGPHGGPSGGTAGCPDAPNNPVSVFDTSLSGGAW